MLVLAAPICQPVVGAEMPIKHFPCLRCCMGLQDGKGRHMCITGMCLFKAGLFGIINVSDMCAWHDA